MAQFSSKRNQNLWDFLSKFTPNFSKIQKFSWIVLYVSM